MKLFPYLLFSVILFGSIVQAQESKPVADVPAKTWKFKALLDGAEMGGHSFSLSEIGPQLKLTSSASFRVNFFFFTAYSYDHTADEKWVNGCLSNLQSETREDSKSTTVSLRREGDSFIAVGPAGEFSVGNCPMTFAYWNPKILTQTRLLNPQTGEWLLVEVRSMGVETISVRGKPVTVERFRITGPKTSIDLWYTKNNVTGEREWVGLESTTPEGYVVRYELI